MKALFALGLAILFSSVGTAHAQKWVTAAPVPQGAEEVYGIAAAGKMYVFGGLAPGWRAMGMTLEYDPASDRWTRKKDMPAYHHHVALAQIDGRIYMFGGFRLPEKGQATWLPVDNAWEYDPAKDTWRALPAAPDRARLCECARRQWPHPRDWRRRIAERPRRRLRASESQHLGRHARSVRSRHRRMVASRPT